MKLFQSATLRLTVWYVLILTVLSLLFSGIVFSIAASELNRPFGTPDQAHKGFSFGVLSDFEELREAREREATTRLITNLVIFNLAVITTGGLASYSLARHTLRPIKEALNAQIRFTSDAAHELRTPLAVIQSEIEVGLRSKITAKKQQELLKSNLDEVERLRSLTDRLLLLSSLKSVELTTAVLDDVATEAINRVMPMAQAKHISIESIIGRQQATANAELLTDTLVILLDNAIKYSPKKSAVTISARDQGKHVLVKITDNGPGIAPENLPHIFDRFYRADTSRSKESVEGYGLGLSIAKRSIEAIGGTISATSEAGKGTTFTLHLNA